MAATTGPKLTVPHTVNTSAIVGQGLAPEAWILYNTADVTGSPSWFDVTQKARNWSTSRGRESELQDFDAGTATVTLDNRDRAFDPLYASSPYYPNLRPRNGIWIREQFSGATQDIFKGYVDSLQQQYPDGGVGDAETVVQATDEFKILNLKKLPAFDPADAPDYAGVVGADGPAGYWRWSDSLLMTTTFIDEYINPVFNEPNPLDEGSGRNQGGGRSRPGYWIHSVTVSGQDWVQVAGGWTIENLSPILGDFVGSAEDGVGGSLKLAASAVLTSTDANAGNMQGSSFGTIECWFQKSGNPGANTIFWGGPDSAAGATRAWSFTLNTTGTVSFAAKDITTATQTVTTAVLSDNVWYHLCAVRDGTNLIIYVNGVNVASTASASGWWGNPVGATPMAVQYPGNNYVLLDEMAVYTTKGLTPARVLAHYTAGTARGFPSQTTDARVNAVLDAVASTKPRTIAATSRVVYPAFMAGTAPLDMIRVMAKCEAVDGMFFVAKNGDLMFLGETHKSVPPWNTTQVTFSDDGVADRIPYLEFTDDYSDSFIANIWNVIKSGRGRIAQTASDATSISRYDEQAQTISDLPVTTNSVAATIAATYLASYKEPLVRGMSVATDTTDPNVTEAVFRLELADRVRVIRTKPRGLGSLDQTLYVQKIEVAGANDGKPWNVRFAVSPV